MLSLEKSWIRKFRKDVFETDHKIVFINNEFQLAFSPNALPINGLIQEVFVCGYDTATYILGIISNPNMSWYNDFDEAINVALTNFSCHGSPSVITYRSIPGFGLLWYPPFKIPVNEFSHKFEQTLWCFLYEKFNCVTSDGCSCDKCKVDCACALNVPERYKNTLVENGFNGSQRRFDSPWKQVNHLLDGKIIGTDMELIKHIFPYCVFCKKFPKKFPHFVRGVNGRCYSSQSRCMCQTVHDRKKDILRIFMQEFLGNVDLNTCDERHFPLLN